MMSQKVNGQNKNHDKYRYIIISYLQHRKMYIPTIPINKLWYIFGLFKNIFYRNKLLFINLYNTYIMLAERIFILSKLIIKTRKILLQKKRVLQN